MKENISDYFEIKSHETKLRMGLYYSAEIDEFIRLSSTIIQTLSVYNLNNKKFDSNRPYHYAYGLMRKGANTLGAAFELSLSGYSWEPPSLLRIALETFAVAWDIVHNPKRFNEWKENKKFSSTISISNAKEVINIIGKLNGVLSKMNVHVSPLNFSPAMVDLEEEYFQLFGFVPKGKEDKRSSEIYKCMLVTYVCLQFTELTFFKYSNSLETIEIMEGTNQAKTKVSAEHRKFVDKMKIVFTKIANGEL